MQTVRDACQLQPNALYIKLSDQTEQLEELITAEGDSTQLFEKTCIASNANGSEALAALTPETSMEDHGA
jgi:hypothetical protein